MAHRLELGVKDVADSLNAISHFQLFLDSLYSFYSRSPKNQSQIREISQELGEIFNLWVRYLMFAGVFRHSVHYTLCGKITQL
jgi:hypothetical protein